MTDAKVSWSVINVDLKHNTRVYSQCLGVFFMLYECALVAVVNTGCVRDRCWKDVFLPTVQLFSWCSLFKVLYFFYIDLKPKLKTRALMRARVHVLITAWPWKKKNIENYCNYVSGWNCSRWRRAKHPASHWIVRLLLCLCTAAVVVNFFSLRSRTTWLKHLTPESDYVQVRLRLNSSGCFMLCYTSAWAFNTYCEYVLRHIKY